MNNLGLSYLLIFLFFNRFTKIINKEKFISLVDIFWIFLLASLVYTNRQDSILLTALPLVQVIILSFKQWRFKIINYIIIGLLPAIIWTVFSLIYYGFLFPNTFYAKLNFGYTGLAVMQGINFMYHICLSDPITMLIIFIAIILPFWIKTRKYKMLSFSLSIYLVYIITTGGDFMGGRFYSVPFLLSILIINDVLINKKNPIEFKQLTFGRVTISNVWLIVICVIIYNIISPVTPIKYFFLRSIKNLNENSQTVKLIPSIFEIKNQTNRTYINGDKSYYFRDSNLMFYSSKGYPIFPSQPQRDKNYCDSCRNDKSFVIIKGGGIYGFCYGPTKFLIDAQSLSDPLIARLPPPDLSDGFFVAHFTKGIPAGYPESCSANKNLIEDQKLREYYEKIRTITRGDIFSLKRLQYIFELNFTSQRKYMEKYKSITSGEANPKIDL